MRLGRCSLPLALLILWGAGSCPSDARAGRLLPFGTEAWAESGQLGIRGVTVGPIESSQQPGRGYGTPYTEALLDHLASMGVNWVSLTPFGRIWSISPSEINMDFEAPYEENRRAVHRMVQQAHARGIKVLIIPHLWSETGGWRGEIDFEDREGWATYQAAYHEFVLNWAKDAALAGADAFSVGVECKSWSGRFGGYWRGLIDDVRDVYPGLLTYSANWDEADNVLFWDKLDLVGVNAFYPLADHEGATDAEYLEGARQQMQNVAAMAETLEMPVLFVEVGYTTRPDAAVEPWLWPDGMSDVVVDEREQARALDAMFHAFLPERWFSGFFIWRYYANLDDVSQEAPWGFSPHAKLAAEVLEAAFHSPWGGDASPWPWLGARP